MEKINVLSHCSYIGTTGISAHFREFNRALSKHCNLKVRNYTIGDSWKGMSKTPHDNEPYINDIDKDVLHMQTLWNKDRSRNDHYMYKPFAGKFDINLVTELVEHYYFYDTYDTPKIGYAVWESTRMVQDFFDKLKTFDEVWAPSKWQKEQMVEQGMDPDFIKVIPGGIDSRLFFPEEVSFDKYYNDGRFKFIVFGRWDYRKATEKIIETFLRTFSILEPVDLILSVDNLQPTDEFKSTEERLKHFGFNDSRIKVVHFASRADYVKFLKKGHVFLSCSRGEGVNLPLMEAMACGTPSIYSNCSGQLEFTENKGLPVYIKGTCPSNTRDDGVYSEPDFDHLSDVMRDAFANYPKHKEKAILDSEEIRKNYDWQVIGRMGADALYSFYNRINQPINKAKERLKVVYITPHLSTGGMPQFLLKRIESIKDECDVYCIEYEQVASIYIVQRNKIVELLGDRFYTLSGQPKENLLDILNTIDPDVVHIEEFPETFMAKEVASKLYRKSRNYLIFESFHGLWFKAEDKVYFPDKLLLVSEYQAEIYKPLNIPIDVVEYPIESHEPNKAHCLLELGFDPEYKHVLNVGLFTKGKNQGELMRYASGMLGDKVKFHFIGNQAENFRDYWEPLMNKLPSNCIVWGERDDVEKFYQAADLMVFVSTFETSPLVIREAISWSLPTLARKIESYRGMYDKYPTVEYLSPNDDANIEKIRGKLGLI